MRVILGIVLYWAALAPVIVNDTDTVLPIGSAPPVCFKTMYRFPSKTFLLNLTELKSLSTTTKVEFIVSEMTI